MSMVGPLHGPKNRLTPSAAPCPAAAWALQGYSGPMQVVAAPFMACCIEHHVHARILQVLSIFHI